MIVAGFQGETAEGQITTLGRGGSDLTAIALAAAVKADLCQIYTDVDGVYTADPRIVPGAKKLPEIAYDEMLELAGAGAKVMQLRSVEFAKKFGVVFEVRSSLNDNPGTIVKEETQSMEGVVVRGVALDKNQAKVTLVRVPDRPGVAARSCARRRDARYLSRGRLFGARRALAVVLGQEALADAGVHHGCFDARIGADQQNDENGFNRHDALPFNDGAVTNPDNPAAA